jgi:hypothetical protein
MKLVATVTLKRASIKEVEQALNKFDENGSEQSKFIFGFRKEMVKMELMEFVLNPDSFHQGIGTALSGDAVLISQYILKYKPLIFVNAIIDLYNNGVTDFPAGKTIIHLKPSQNIRKWAISVDQNKFAKATAQLFMLSLREHFNEIDYYNGAQNCAWASTLLQTIWATSELTTLQRLAEELLDVECAKIDLNPLDNNSDSTTSLLKIQELIDSGKITIVCVKYSYLKNLDKIEAGYYNHSPESIKGTRFIRIINLKQLWFQKIQMEWWDYGGQHTQEMPLKDFNSMISGGIYIPIP